MDIRELKTTKVERFKDDETKCNHQKNNDVKNKKSMLQNEATTTTTAKKW